MYSGQIFALLGHNRAGKTTALAMLTGLLSKTSGPSQMLNYNLFDNLRIFQNLGLCPQQNLFYEELTVQEHMEIFSALKGLSHPHSTQNINELLDLTQLNESRDVKAKNLSGGQMRKLNVAFVFIGESKILMLDEPTSGMDASSRKMWDLLKRKKREKIIILTTHYMVISLNLFILSRYGIGYQLKIVKTSKQEAPELEQFIKSFIPSASKLIDIGTDATFSLPFDASHSFPQFFSNFEQEIERLKVQSYGISVTTLEDVFILVGKNEEESQVTDTTLPSLRISSSSYYQGSKHVYSIADQNPEKMWKELSRDSWAKMKQKTLQSIRSAKTFLFEMFVPFILVLIALINTKGMGVTNYTPEIYPSPQYVIMNDEYFVSTEKVEKVFSTFPLYS